MSENIIMQNLALVKKVEELANAKGVKPGQLALAWVHAQHSAWDHYILWSGGLPQLAG